MAARPSLALSTLPDSARERFRDRPLAFLEEPEEERGRLAVLRREDLIGLQDTLNTSRALVQAVKDEDIDELRRVVAEAEAGELLQVFVLQAFVVALKGAMLEMVKEMICWGVPLDHDQLSLSPHVICDITTRDNFSNAWRILELLFQGNGESRISVDTPRLHDGWTPLCVSCHRACLPLVFKLLEMQADVNVVTRSGATPLSLASATLSEDDEEQKEARGIICNMLRHNGAQLKADDAVRASLKQSRKPRESPGQIEQVPRSDGSGTTIQRQQMSATHTRFSA